MSGAKILSAVKKFENIASPIATPTLDTIIAMALVQTDPDAYVIKPAAAAPAIDTSDWPLLLKNYSDRMLQLPHSSRMLC